MDIKVISIEEIGLSVRSVNALHRADVFTVGDMLQHSEESLMQIRNLGQKSVQEILEKIAEYTQYLDGGVAPVAFADSQGNVVVPAEWVLATENQGVILAYFENRESEIDELELLSAKAYNLLQINGFEKIHQVLFLSHDQLMSVSRMESQTAEEITKLCCRFLKNKADEICTALLREQPVTLSISEMLLRDEYREVITEYVTANGWELEKTSLPNRAKNQLGRNGYSRMSQIIFLSKEQLLQLPAMGAASAKAVQEIIEKYLQEHENRLIAACRGDFSAMYDDLYVQHCILQLYGNDEFGGYSLSEMIDRLSLPKEVGVDRVKKNVGALLAARELEYVDYRCYRIYGKFLDYFENCSLLDERERDCIRKKLAGLTLEGIGHEYSITRERVRQILKNGIEKVRNHYMMQTGKCIFDEEYYRYLYETYEFDKQDGEKWLGIPAYVWNFLNLIDAKPGKRDIAEAMNDPINVGLGMRLKIKNYCNRDKLFIDGIWVEKKRISLERAAAKRFCAESTSFSKFCDQYNEMLRQEGIAIDSDLYIHDENRRSLSARMMERHYILWAKNETMRYYDIDSHDYSELLETLQLDTFENVELSTAKFMKNYPDVMKKYDIRNHYELHNLLRKIVTEGDIQGFCCGRTPYIVFGSFERDRAIWELLVNNAPISYAELCTLIEAEYGYDQAVIPNYLQSFAVYYHHGMYTIDQKKMSEESKTLLKAVLTEDFYFIDEIKKIYKQILPGADLDEVNSYNLKSMGFIVLSRYVVQNHPSLEAYYKNLLTQNEIVDIAPYRKRFAYIQAFSQILMELKRNLAVVEFEQDKLIQFHKLEKEGVTWEKIQGYCDIVFNCVSDGTYFSIQSLRQKGFTHELFDLGFSDWFYANLLLSDGRFAVARIYGTLILCKNETAITIQSFLINRIQEHRMIDAYDLLSELTDHYGCNVEEKSRMTYRLESTDIYYDRILDRFYANVDAYYEDLTGGEI